MGIWGCKQGLLKKKKKKLEMLMHPGCAPFRALLEGEWRNTPVELVSCFMLPCVWLGLMQIFSGFWVWFVKLGCDAPRLEDFLKELVDVGDRPSSPSSV